MRIVPVPPKLSAEQFYAWLSQYVAASPNGKDAVPCFIQCDGFVQSGYTYSSVTVEDICPMPGTDVMCVSGRVTAVYYKAGETTALNVGGLDLALANAVGYILLP